MTKKQNCITGSPSKFTLSDSFFGKDGSDRRKVTFLVYGPDFPRGLEKVEVVLNRLEWEDGSGDSWGFYGHSTSHFPGESVSGWFRTDKRRGYLCFGDEPVIAHNKDKIVVVITQHDKVVIKLRATITQPIEPFGDSFGAVITIDRGQDSKFDGSVARAIWDNKSTNWVISYAN